MSSNLGFGEVALGSDMVGVGKGLWHERSLSGCLALRTGIQNGIAVNQVIPKLIIASADTACMHIDAVPRLSPLVTTSKGRSF